MLAEKIKIDTTSLIGKTVIITGGGGGIATEAGKVLAYLGANVVLAEVDEQRGLDAQRYIGTGWKGNAIYYPLDLTVSQSISSLYEYVIKQHGSVDAIIHNATVTPFDSVESLPLSSWDTSYLVHLRGPIELTRKFLPCMKNNSGTIVFNPSTGAMPFMGAYEVFKNAQVVLANTLASELENSGIHVFTVAPGLAKTKTATAGIEKVVPMMGITVDEFFTLYGEYAVSVEEAGTAFAVSLLFANQYHGREIWGLDVLTEAGIIGVKDTPSQDAFSYSPQNEVILTRLGETFNEQYEDWKNRNLFERQWILRDFRKVVGHSADEILQMLDTVISAYKEGRFGEQFKLKEVLTVLRIFYVHQIELAQEHIKNTKEKESSMSILKGRIDDIDTLLKP